MSDTAALRARIELDASQYRNQAQAVQASTNAVIQSMSGVSSASKTLEQQYKALAAQTGYFADAQGRIRTSTGQFAKASDETAQALRAMRKELQTAGVDMKAFDVDVGRTDKSIKAFGVTSYDVGVGIGTGINIGTKAAIAGLTAVGAKATATFALFAFEAKQAAEIYNKAMQLNVNTNDLQSLQLAAERFGVTGEKVNDILKDINDKFGDMSADQGGEMVNFFEKLGLRVEDFIGKDPVTVLKAVSEAADGLSTQERTWIFESMGNDLTFLKPLLDENSRGLSENIEKAQRFGQILSGAELSAYREFNVTLQDIGARFDGMKTRVLAGLVEPMKEGIVFVDDWIESLGGAEVVAANIADSLVSGIGMAVDGAAFLAKGFVVIKETVGAIVDGLALVIRGTLEAAEYATKYTIPGFSKTDIGKSTLDGINKAQAGLDDYLGNAKSLSARSSTIDNALIDIESWAGGLKSSVERGRQASVARGRSDDGLFGQDDGALSREKYRNNELKAQLEEQLKEQRELIKYQAKSADDLAAHQLEATKKVTEQQIHAAESLTKAAESLTGKNGYSITESGFENGSYEEYRATMFKYTPSYFQDDINNGWKPENTPQNAKAAQGFWGGDWGDVFNGSQSKQSNSAKDMGSITLQVASKDGIIAAIPFISQIENIEKFQNAVGNALGSIAATGRATQS